MSEPGESKSFIPTVFAVVIGLAPLIVMLSIGIHELKQTVSTETIDAHALSLKGERLVNRGQIEKGVAVLQRSLALNPDSSKTHFYLGITYESEGNIHEAIEHFHRALAIDPAYSQAHNHLATTLNSQGSVEEAITHFRQALKIRLRTSAQQPGDRFEITGQAGRSGISFGEGANARSRIRASAQ
jgi:tetratricopeptide (TPR) repeat protein